MTLGKTLKDARVRKGFTLRDVEKLTGISNGHLSLIESGAVVSPSPSLLSRLAGEYGTSYALLMELAGHQPPSPILNSTDALTALGLDELSPPEIEQVKRFVGYLRASRPSEPARQRRKS